MKFISYLKKLVLVRRPNKLKVVVLCIVTATTFWLFNELNKTYDASVYYPIEWGFSRDTYVVIDELPEEIQMNVKGLGWNLIRASYGFNIKPMLLFLDAPAATKKISGASLATEVSENLGDLQLNYIIVDTLAFNIDLKAKKRFYVAVDSLNISLEQHYRLVSPIVLDVDSVDIEGPKNIIESLSDTLWVSINSEEISSDYDGDVSFDLPRRELLEVIPNSLHVSFEVGEFTNASKLLPISIFNVPEDSSFFLRDTLATVNYLVNTNETDNVIDSLFVIEADFDNINKNDSTLELILKSSPNNVFEAQMDSSIIDVSYK